MLTPQLFAELLEIPAPVLRVLHTIALDDKPDSVRLPTMAGLLAGVLARATASPQGTLDRAHFVADLLLEGSGAAGLYTPLRWMALTLAAAL